MSRPFSSYFRQLGTLIAHPVRFYEVLPKVQDPRAPGLFTAFSAALAAVFWFVFSGWIAALLALILTIPASLVFAGVCYVVAFGGRYDFLITWRAVAYPFGFAAPLLAVPFFRWVVLVVFLFAITGAGLRTVQEVPAVRAFGGSFVAAAVVGVLLFLFG